MVMAWPPEFEVFASILQDGQAFLQFPTERYTTGNALTCTPQIPVL